MTRLIILEGIDGAGKSTLASQLKSVLMPGVPDDPDVRVVHHGPHLQVRKGLARLYVESMLPALHGDAHIILDRSWLSEAPYGLVYRETDRLGWAQRRMLERIAMRCETLVIYCDPGWEAVRTTYLKRKGEEYVQSLDKLQAIYANYGKAIAACELPVFTYDYTKHTWADVEAGLANRTTAHAQETETAGNALAQVLVVGESYAQLTDADPLYQKPFCAFSGTGCSLWLTQQLGSGGIPERQLLWCNSDHLDHVDMTPAGYYVKHVVALGTVAGTRCREHFRDTLPVHEVVHPQAWKRFKDTPYPLVPLLKQLLEKQ